MNIPKTFPVIATFSNKFNNLTPWRVEDFDDNSERRTAINAIQEKPKVKFG